MSQDHNEQPIEFITQATTMNSVDDPTTLKDSELALIQNFVKSNGVFEVREGKTLLNTGNLLPAACFGLSTFKPLDSNTMHYVAVTNSDIYAGTSFPLTDKNVTGGVTASTLMRMQPFNGKMLINDPSKGMAWYDGTDAGWAGVTSPKLSILIEDFESVTGWSTTNGTCAVDDTQVVHGRHGLKFKASSGATYSPRKTITSLSLSAFPAAPSGDGTSTTDQDYIRLQVVRSFKADFTTCDLILQSSGGNYGAARLSDFPEWINNDGAGLTFDIFIRKGAFQATGTPNYAAITVVGFDIVAATGKQPFISVDWLRLERRGPYAQIFGKLIADFESDETWSAGGFNYIYKCNLARSITIGQNIATYRDYSPVLDLTKFDNGLDADTIDSIEIKVARDTSKVAGTLTLTFRDSGSDTATYDINATSILTPRVGGVSLNKLKDPTLVFQLFTIRKDQFTGASMNWEAVNRLTLTASNHAGTYYADSIRLVKTRDKKTIFDFEKASGTPTVSGAVKSGWADPNKDPVRTDEGSSTSFYVKIANATECTIDIPFSPDIDLSAFASGATSQAGDTLGPYIWISDSESIEEIALLYDTDAGTFASYYAKQLLRGGSQIPPIKKDWFKARFERREHEQIPATGATGTWATVDKIRLKITTSKKGGGVECYIDQWLMGRGEQLSGRFWYGFTFVNPRGSRSDFSNISNMVEVKSAGVSLTNIPISTGCLREIWRIGGLSTTWRLVGIMGDDESTMFEDWLTEGDLGIELPLLYDPPMICQTFCVHDNLVVRGNLTEVSGGYQHKTMIEISPEHSFDVVDGLSRFELGKDDGFKILLVESFNDRIIVFKERGIWSFNPYNLDEKPICHSRELGIISSLAYCIDPRGSLFFINVDKTIWSFNGSTFDDQFGSDISDYLDDIPNAYVHLVVGEYFDGYALFSIPQTAETSNSTILAYENVKMGTWSVITGWPTSIFHVQSYAGASKLIGGSPADGSLFQLFEGDTDSGSVIVGILRTRDGSPDPTITKQPSTLYMTARKLTGTNGTVKVEPYYDLTDSTNDLDFDITDATHQRIPEAGTPSPNFWPTYLGFKITTGVARVAIRSLAYSVREEERR